LLAANAIPAGIETINLAGEPLAQSLVDRLYAQGFKAVYDLYGPSEDTTYSTYVLRQPQGRASIGRPLTNTCAWLLNAAGQLVAPGLPGELHLGGAGLSRGYLHRPELTAEKFIANPFAENARYNRLYKTGDLARWLPNGELEYLGRLDHQVKIRGFRIELGDIEQALLEHPAVAKALVLAKEFGAGDKRLLAYVVTHSAEQLADNLPADLRSHLLARLPDFMLPSVLVPLAEFPLTANGKINRAALPIPTLSETQTEYVAPANATEQILCEIWQEVLGVERVGVLDNFFQLGGHSLLLVKMTGLAAYRGLHISVRQAFAAEHIRALAANCVAVADAREWKSITGPVPIAPNLAYSLAVTSADRDRWLMVNLLQASQPLQAEYLGQALALLIERHDALRLSHYQDEQGHWQSEILPPKAELPLEIVDCMGLDEAALAKRATEARERIDANSNLVSGPLIQLALFDRGDQPSRLMVSVHHYAVDAIAFGLLLQELQHIYSSLASGAELRLPPPTPGYGDYARFVGDYAATPACTAQVDYWQSLGRRDHNLPVDYDNRHLDSWRLREFKTLTPVASLNELLAAGHGEQVHAAILSALLLAYQRWSGRDYLHLNLVTNGRQLDEPAPDLSHCIGWVSYMNPVVLNLANTNLVPFVQQQLNDIPRDNSFGILKFCHPDPAIRERMAQLPEPQINFNYFAQGTAPATAVPAATQLAFWPVPYNNSAPAGDLNQDIVVKPGARLMHYLMLSCDLFEEKVRMSWMYVPELFADSTINQLAADFARSLKDVMDQISFETQPSPNKKGSQP
jgi:non-ribosomal peptide synthase protein (TIGR01720 family)